MAHRRGHRLRPGVHHKTKPAVLRATRGEFEALFQQMGLSAAPMFETSSETGAGKVELLRFIAAEVASVQADGEDEEDSSEVDGPHPSEGDRTAAG
jgi:hypothetical protein